MALGIWPCISLIAFCVVESCIACTSLRLRPNRKGSATMSSPMRPETHALSSPIRPHRHDGAAARCARAGSAAGALRPAAGGPNVLRNLTAAYELIARAGLTHVAPALRHRPACMVGNREVAVTEEAVADRRRSARCCISQGRRDRRSRACCSWRRCRATSPRCCATRCARCCPTTTSTSPTGTTRATCRSDAGRFGFDDYVEHIIQFLETLGPGAHVVAVCQPCVAGAGGRRA